MDGIFPHPFPPSRSLCHSERRQGKSGRTNPLIPPPASPPINKPCVCQDPSWLDQTPLVDAGATICRYSGNGHPDTLLMLPSSRTTPLVRVLLRNRAKTPPPASLAVEQKQDDGNDPGGRSAAPRNDERAPTHGDEPRRITAGDASSLGFPPPPHPSRKQDPLPPRHEPNDSRTRSLLGTNARDELEPSRAQGHATRVIFSPLPPRPSPLPSRDLALALSKPLSLGNARSHLPAPAHTIPRLFVRRPSPTDPRHERASAPQAYLTPPRMTRLPPRSQGRVS